MSNELILNLDPDSKENLVPKVQKEQQDNIEKVRITFSSATPEVALAILVQLQANLMARLYNIYDSPFPSVSETNKALSCIDPTFTERLQKVQITLAFDAPPSTPTIISTSIPAHTILESNQ